MLLNLTRAAGVLVAALTFAIAAPAVAAAQTASWNDPTYGAVIHAHKDWVPYVTSVAHNVSTETIDRASLARDGDAESVALTYAEALYTANVAAVDPANTYGIGDSDTKLTSASPTSRTWDTWVIIYTIDHPTQGYRYCEFNYTVNAELSSETWETSATFKSTACRNLNFHEPSEPAPIALQATVWPSSASLAVMNRSSAERNVILNALLDWEDRDLGGSGTSYGVNFSMPLDADSWFVIFTIYDTAARYACTDGWTVDFDTVEPIGAATVSRSGGEYCRGY